MLNISEREREPYDTLHSRGGRVNGMRQHKTERNLKGKFARDGARHNKPQVRQVKKKPTAGDNGGGTKRHQEDKTTLESEMWGLLNEVSSHPPRSTPKPKTRKLNLRTPVTRPTITRKKRHQATDQKRYKKKRRNWNSPK